MDRDPGGSLKSLRRNNQERLLGLLLTHGPIHRAGLARRADLSRTTVSTIITDLMARGLVVESDEGSEITDRDGRAREMLAVNPTAAVVAGLDFTLTAVWAHISDLARREIASGEVAVDPALGPSDRIDIGISLLDSLLDKHGLERNRVIGAGIGVPGPIDQATGVVGVSLPGQPFSHVHAAEEFNSRLGLPVFIENNTRLEAVAEARWGAGKGVENLLYFGLSSGIGSGLILDGRLYRGAIGAAGELGHVSVNIDGPACPCGNRGCLVGYAGIPAVLAALRPALGDDITIDGVLAATAAGDRACQGVFADVGNVVGRLLANLCNLLNPERIVVGGELSRAGDALLAPMRDSIQRYALSLVRDVEVVPAALDLGGRAGAVGGAALVLSETPYLARALDRLAGARG